MAKKKTHPVVREMERLLGKAAKATTRTPTNPSKTHYAIVLSAVEYVRLVRLCNQHGASDAD